MAHPISLNPSSHPSPPPSYARHLALDVDQLIERGQAAELSGHRGNAREHYECALSRLDRTAQSERAATLLRWIARTYTTDADLDAAMDCATAALAISQACGDRAGEGHAVNVQAVVHWRRADLDSAEK